MGQHQIIITAWYGKQSCLIVTTSPEQAKRFLELLRGSGKWDRVEIEGLEKDATD